MTHTRAAVTEREMELVCQREELRQALADALAENEQLRSRLELACEPCAECGHVDWRELHDILEAGLHNNRPESKLPMIPEPSLTPEERARLSEALRRGDGPPISPSRIEVYVVMLMYDLDQAALAAFTDEGEARAWGAAYLGDEFSAAAYRAGERGSRWSVVHLPAKHESPF